MTMKKVFADLKNTIDEYNQEELGAAKRSARVRIARAPITRTSKRLKILDSKYPKRICPICKEYTPNSRSWVVSLKKKTGSCNSCYHKHLKPVVETECLEALSAEDFKALKQRAKAERINGEQSSVDYKKYIKELKVKRYSPAAKRLLSLQSRIALLNELVPDRRCHRCGTVKLKSSQWVITGKIAQCKSCYQKF